MHQVSLLRYRASALIGCITDIARPFVSLSICLSVCPVQAVNSNKKSELMLMGRATASV